MSMMKILFNYDQSFVNEKVVNAKELTQKPSHY